ncbi:hypothetical protein JWJ90_05140 [Desulfobulbus rhabdoformis]|uniref:hypothetical protein n=1 Tax=Desulfobulbus rhabdoformis TaxID=34032 RepID=UPI001962362E|nr:hypothetical protein [Desulfobulbus rhabdoformis]MBM9613671.1 hypothetical protein [Desulfobulbus rhabdoformis]
MESVVLKMWNLLIFLAVIAGLLAAKPGFATAGGDLGRLKEQTSEQVRTLPMDSPQLHKILLSSGQRFEQAGVYSQAVRYYRYLDSVWEKFPPQNQQQHQQLKVKIMSLSTRQDTAQIETARAHQQDSLLLYQESYRPGQTLLCKLRAETASSVWLVLKPVDQGGTPPKDLPLPVLYAHQALDDFLALQLPTTPGEYILSAYNDDGLLARGTVTVLSAPTWAGQLKIETEGYPGFNDMPVRPKDSFACVLHHKKEWLAGKLTKKIWLGLYRAADPEQGADAISTWSIGGKKELTQITTRINAPGEYQLRLYSREGEKQELLLSADVVVGEPKSVRGFSAGTAAGEPLLLQAQQKIKIANAGLGLKRIRGLDPRCLLVPSWFHPLDIRHGLNHALVSNIDLPRGDGSVLELPGSGGEFNLLYYPHWLALQQEAAPVQLARFSVQEERAARLVINQSVVPPGASIRAAARVGSLGNDLQVYLLPEENLQLRQDKARYVAQKRHSVFLEAKKMAEGWGWFDITAPLQPGKYVLAGYSARHLVAAVPVQVAPRPKPQAEIVLAPGEYETGQPYSFKLFPPAQGMEQSGSVALYAGDRVVQKRNISLPYMDFPLTLQGPQQPGSYTLRYFVGKASSKQDQLLFAERQLRFVDRAALTQPDFTNQPEAVHPQAVAAFQKKAALSGSGLAEFTLFKKQAAPGEEVLISYSLPPGVPACMILVPRGVAADSLALALKGAVQVHELNPKNDVFTLRAPKSGQWDLCFYDTLQWAKAGAPSLLATLPMDVVAEGGARQLFHSKAAFAQGALVLRMQTGETDLSKAERTVRLYPQEVNFIRNDSAAVASTVLEPLFDGWYQGKMQLDLPSGRYQLRLADAPLASALEVMKNRPLEKLAAVSLRGNEQELLPQALVEVDFSPASAWKEGWAWAWAGKNDKGEFVFLQQPQTVKKGRGQVVRKAIKLPRTSGQYQLCMWQKSDKVAYTSLPQDAVQIPLHIALPNAYLQAHKPKVALQSYFATDTRLYADMFTDGTFIARKDFDASAWIGLLPQQPSAATLDAASAKKIALWSTTLSGRDQGHLSLHTPKQPGTYQLVMFDGAKDGTLVFQETLTLHQADTDLLNRVAEKEAGALLEALPDPEEEQETIREAIREQYKEQLEVPRLRPTPVSQKMFEQLQGSTQEKDAVYFAEAILELFSPQSACAATSAKDCEADIDLAIANMRKVNINFGDGVNVRQVVSELATNMASDLVMGQKHIAQAKQYYDTTKGYYEQAMRLKAGVEKNGWQETVEGALWNSTQAMLNSCVTDGCLSKLGRKAIEYKLKGYNPTKMSKAQQEAWKQEYTRMVVLLNKTDLRAIETQTAKFAALAGKLAVPDPAGKAKEMAKSAAISTMKSVTLSMASAMPGYTALKAYYETLNVLRGALIDKETVEFMDAYRKLRKEGGTIAQVNTILAGKQVNYLMTSLRQRIEANPRGYKQYLTEANNRRAIDGKAIQLSAGEIDTVIMSYMEKWYQQERADEKKDRYYQKMKDAWFASQCRHEAFRAEVAKKNFFGTMEEIGGHYTSSLTGALSGKQTYSSVTCARKAVAFKNFLNLRGQIIGQMAGWQKGKEKACRLGTRENNRLIDKLTCQALTAPATYKTTMVSNAEACGALPKPLPAKVDPKIKQLSKKSGHALEVLLRISGNTNISQCLCNRHSVMGSGCSYHPQPTKGSSPACDNPGPPCIQGNWGCSRLHPATDRASLEACGFAEAMRDFRRKDSAQYKKWLKWRKKYMQQ